MHPAKFYDGALMGLGYTVLGLAWIVRMTGWLMIASAAFLLVVDLLFWMRMGLWDIFRTGLALHDMGFSMVTQWKGLQHVYDWISGIPLAASLFVTGLVVVGIDGGIREALD